MTEVIRGVDMSRVDRKVMSKFVKAFALNVDTSNDSMVVGLTDYFMKKNKADPKLNVKCDHCHGLSDLSVERCPYCGKGDEDPVPAAPPKSVDDVKVARPAKAKAPKEPAPEAPANDSAPKKKRSRSEALAKVESNEVVHKAEVVEVIGPPKLEDGSLATVGDLDREVSEIEEMQRDISVSHWKLGVALHQSHVRRLFVLRLDENGKQKYRSWNQYVEAELKFGVRYALDLAAVSQVFTEAQINEFGVTKLRPIVRIPEEAKRANLLKRARDEVLTRAEITKEVQDSGAGPRKSLGKTDRTEPAAKQTQKRLEREEAKKNQITVVVQPGIKTIPLFSGIRPKELAPARAFDLEDEPSGSDVLFNGVRVSYRLVKEEEGLALVVELAREPE